MRYYDRKRYEDPYKNYDWDNDGFPGEYVYGDDIYCGRGYEDEVWKPVKDFPDYWVSDYGRVYSTRTERFIHGTPTGRCGHIDISFKYGNERYHRYLHRLVAEAFIPNPHNYPIVRHLDDNPDNNYADNLAWGTPLDNVRDCINAGRFEYFKREDIEKANEVRRTPVIAVNLRTGKETYFVSQEEAGRCLGINQSSIWRVLVGKGTNAGGYYFYYEKDPKKIDIHNHRYSRHFAPIRAIDSYTGKEWMFRGQTEAANELGLSVASVSMVLSGKMKQAKGYYFEYADEEE